jgi:hypothetical protein
MQSYFEESSKGIETFKPHSIAAVANLYSAKQPF